MQEVLKEKDVIKFGLRGMKEFVDYNWHGRMISIKYMLTREEYIDLFGRIESMCTANDGTLLPEYVDFALRMAVVATFAGIEIPSDIDEAYKLMYHSDIFDVVRNNANKAQTESIIHYFEPWR